MATQSLDQDLAGFRHQVERALSAVGEEFSRMSQALGPHGRRFALTGVGAIIALGLGAAAASAVRLPSDMKDPAPAQDQALVQTELPSEAAARAYALENPPAMTAAKTDSDTAALNAVDTASTDDADSVTKVSYTGPSSDDDQTSPKADAASPMTQAAPASAGGADNAGAEAN
jgi:hypothetical protein